VGTAETTPQYRQLELLIEAGNGTDALALAAELVQNDPANRQLQLYSLLAQIIAFGPERFEAEIDRVRSMIGVPEPEHAIITKILRHGFESAIRKGDQGKAWAYQRSLRRWVAGLPSDRPLSGLRLEEGDGKKAPSASFTAVESTSLRNVFSAERDDDDAAANAQVLRFNKIARNNVQPIAALQRISATVRDGAAARLAAMKKGWLDKVAARRTAGTRRKTTERVHRPSRTGVKVALVACAFITGAGVSVIAMKFGKATSEKPRIGTALEQPPVLPEAVPVLAPIDLPSAEKALSTDVAPSQLSSPPSQPATRDSEKTVQANVLAVPRQDREAKAVKSGRELRLVFKAMQTIGLRDEPRFSAPKGHPLETGTRLIVMERNGSWIKVRNEATGSTGFVRREFVAPDS
jgi:hypothetical protein